jgi:RNA polymerase sigma-70 factor, ECF subfamily
MNKSAASSSASAGRATTPAPRAARWCTVAGAVARASRSFAPSAPAGAAVAFDGQIDAVYRVLRRAGVNAVDAEDLTQEVFVVVCRRWRDYDSTRPLRPWLLGIAVRVAHEHRRRRPRELPRGVVEAADAAPDPHAALAAREARALIDRALARLSERQRTVFVLHELEGVAMSDLARALDVPLPTLYSRLGSARRQFTRAVRRLTAGAAPAAARGLVLAPEALIALARSEDAPPVPAALRGRLRARLRELEGHPPAVTPSRPRAGARLALELAAGAAVLVAVLALLLSRSPSSAAARASAVVAVAARFASAPASARAPAFSLASAPRLATAPGLAPPAPDAPAALDLGAGLVGYWRFDDGAGSDSARDHSGNHVDCRLRGLDPRRDWVAGKRGGAVNLTGAGWLECPDPPFGREPDLTVAVWVQRTRAPRGHRVLAARQTGSGVRDHFFFGFVNGELFVSSHVWGGPLHSPVSGAPDRWVHAAAVHRDGVVKLFIDGALVGQRRSYRGRVVDAASPLLVGAGANGPDPRVTTQRFVGALDELAVYRRALGDAEIAALAAGAQPR